MVFRSPGGEDLARWLRRKAGGAGYGVGWLAQKIVGPVTIGRDPFSTIRACFTT
jgi:cellulose synthase (UDP-forming)